MKRLSYIIGEIIGRGVSISLPPLISTFELPNQNELLDLSVGDSVKLIFEQKERMWVTITRTAIESDSNWEGTLDNSPITVNAKHGDKVRFHPLAIISYIREKERVL